MADEPRIAKHGDLDIHYHPTTGQISRVYDRRLEMQVIAYDHTGGSELEINGQPIPLRLESIDEWDDDAPAFQANLSAVTHPSVGCYQGFDVMRMAVVGSANRPWGNHLNPAQSLHISYRVERKQVHRYRDEVNHSAGMRPIQMPLWLDTIGTLCNRTDWFGPETKMMSSCPGGAGPPAHVGHDEGPVAEVAAKLWNTFRRQHPGMQMIPGAAFYHEDGRWVWITAQRPTVGMQWIPGKDRFKAQFQYHAQLSPTEIIRTPEVSFYWGRGGREQMLRTMNKQFIAYEEPGDWFYHTTWFWFHWWQYREHGFADMADQVRFLHDELGLTGFGITTHDLRPGNWDCGPSSLRPTPHWGGDQGVRKLAEAVREVGGKMYVWLPSLGLGQPSHDLKQDWMIKGEDGRPFEGFYIGSYDLYNSVNFNHPEVQAYYLDWIRRYIRDYHVEGIFWDCGGAPLAADFSPPQTRPFQRFPSESMISFYRFCEKVMRVGRECSPDFFMWHETFSAELPGTGYSSHSGSEDFLMELDRAGDRPLVYRSGSAYNLYGHFARINPNADTAFRSPLTIDTYRPMASDPMNRWLVKFVKDHGIRDAVGIHRSVALCHNHLVVDPSKQPRQITVPPWAASPKALTNVLTGEKVQPEKTDDAGVHFTLEGAAAYEIE